jgi:hypothetical protein
MARYYPGGGDSDKPERAYAEWKKLIPRAGAEVRAGSGVARCRRASVMGGRAGSSQRGQQEADCGRMRRPASPEGVQGAWCSGRGITAFTGRRVVAQANLTPELLSVLALASSVRWAQ